MTRVAPRNLTELAWYLAEYPWCELRLTNWLRKGKVRAVKCLFVAFDGRRFTFLDVNAKQWPIDFLDRDGFKQEIQFASGSLRVSSKKRTIFLDWRPGVFGRHCDWKKS